MASTTVPARDPFYSYPGSLQGLPAGTVLRTRQVRAALGGGLPVLTATQVLYRTTDALGEPSATVATVIRPLVSSGSIKLLSYQEFYDGINSKCRPSYVLEGGDPSNVKATVDATLAATYVLQGYTLVTSDYEGPHDDWGAGREAGQNTLDAIIAAEHVLGLTQSGTPVGLVGYSGGSIATMWAAELQPSYAPGLKLIGTAAGGIPVDFAHNLAYIDGSTGWAGAIPAVAIGLMRAYHLDPSEFFNARGIQIAGHVAQGCLDESGYPHLKFTDLLKPQYRNWTQIPALVRLFNSTIMGRTNTPTEPLLMAVGSSDETGDGVMIAKDVQQLAYQYCQQKANVQFHAYPGENHYAALVGFETQALQFLNQRYAGQTTASNCATITPGNPLTPLPTPTTTKPATAKVKLTIIGPAARLRGLVIAIQTSSGTLQGVTVELTRNRKIAAKAHIARLTTHPRRIVLTPITHTLTRGRYSINVLLGRRVILARTLTLKTELKALPAATGESTKENR